MKKHLPHLMSLLMLLALSSPIASAQQLAFPGAEGFGRFTTGGRGGTVIEVTNLNDSGPGSFRSAVLASGARTIVFRVSGTIKLLSPLSIKNGDLTIAGQTAPGDGICLSNQTVTLDADNVIIRYLRFRLGDEAKVENDAIWGRNHQNIIIDHCSMSWSVDETASFYLNRNFTMQWCILSESLYKSVHDKGNHGYGGIWGGDQASFHHNLLAHHSSRNPRFNGGGRSGINGGTYPKEHVDFRNNVLYNWADNSAYGGENGQYNLVNNYYKPGPATPGSKNKRIVQVSFEADPAYGAGYGTFYINGNHVEGNAAVTQDNWAGGVDYASNLPIEKRAQVKLTAPIAYHMQTDHTAVEAYEAVLAQAGASLKRDPVDTRIIREVRTGTATYGGAFGEKKGIIDTQATVGGWPVLESLPAPADTDHDGMPDAWETQYGLNPNNPADRNADANNNGYTNLEEYLNGQSPTALVTSAKEEVDVFASGAYPNPFSRNVTFTFTSAQKAVVSLKILDLAGREITTVRHAAMGAGAHKVEWNGTDASGRKLGAGLYLYSLQMGKERVVKRIALVHE
ncbi:T9SS C-terminal target domain-containing protein [Rufibacter immobilis]|uniref:T9SS C-terminal target domain-containing protein n=1 Tax=Rufibacter immobilis TaxID=1348778 RepID=A0A3M9MRZ2_9BACT|nr:FlgD immunoglobulin-like domain containing protein [Rufibacter immobilis]RNI28280.1 T9SS C-terminal target domain-containing protein [Rufibacter immobilis]